MQPTEPALSLWSESETEAPPDPEREPRRRPRYVPPQPMEKRDDWSAVAAECPEHRSPAEHADRMHTVKTVERPLGGPWGALPYVYQAGAPGTPAATTCEAWRPLRPGERATVAWIEATAHPHAQVQDIRAREAQYPPPAMMAFQMDTGRELDALAEKNAARWTAERKERRNDGA